MLVFFFFKQKTAYEMRISDWSSDVCSSDLRRFARPPRRWSRRRRVRRRFRSAPRPEGPSRSAARHRRSRPCRRGGFPLQKAGLAGSPPSAIAGVQPTQYRDHRILTYTPPVAEQRFLLRHIVKLDELAGHNAYAEATPDVVDAILEGAGQCAAGEVAQMTTGRENV